MNQWGITDECIFSNRYSPRSLWDDNVGDSIIYFESLLRIYPTHHNDIHEFRSRI